LELVVVDSPAAVLVALCKHQLEVPEFARLKHPLERRRHHVQLHGRFLRLEVRLAPACFFRVRKDVRQEEEAAQKEREKASAHLARRRRIRRRRKKMGGGGVEKKEKMNKKK
jgi:hypothetical protein